MGINGPDFAKTRGTCYCFSVLLFDVSFAELIPDQNYEMQNY